MATILRRTGERPCQGSKSYAEREGAAADAKFAATGVIQTERQVFGLAREFLGRSERGAVS